MIKVPGGKDLKGYTLSYPLLLLYLCCYSTFAFTIPLLFTLPLLLTLAKHRQKVEKKIKI
jgi:hypothetical protein